MTRAEAARKKITILRGISGTIDTRQFPSVEAVSVPWWGYFGRLTHHGGSPTLLCFDTVPEQSEIVLAARGSLTSFDAWSDLLPDPWPQSC